MVCLRLGLNTQVQLVRSKAYFEQWGLKSGTQKATIRPLKVMTIYISIHHFIFEFANRIWMLLGGFQYSFDLDPRCVQKSCAQADFGSQKK